jgi:hypothetical protein
MFDWYKYNIIRNLKPDSKVVIGIGDSFTQGQGACSEDVWEKYNWDMKNVPDSDEIAVDTMFYENSWVNQLCKNHLTDYTPINFGMVGRGNRAAVKQLSMHPAFRFDKIKEKIVIFMLTGMERFDFVHKNLNQHVHFKTMWPSDSYQGEEKVLWNEYLTQVYSNRSATIELILNIHEAQTWCRANNAKLILMSAFSTDYNRETFYERIRGEKTEENYLYGNIHYLEELMSMVNWEVFLRPDGYSCVADFLCHLEGRDDLIGIESSAKYYDYAYSSKKISKSGFITPCAHPSINGHKEIARSINDYIVKNDLLINNQKNKLI